VKALRFWKSREFGTALVLAAMLLGCEVGARLNSGHSFLTWDNLGRVLGDFSLIGIASIGACAVIVSGGVDLSPGAVMCLSGVAVAHLYVNQKAPALLALGAGLAAGSAVGLANGILVGRLKLPPFIATLGLSSIARGIAYWVTGGQPISLDWENSRRSTLGFAWLGSHPAWTMVALGVGATVILERSRWGRAVYAVGGNEEAARFAGLPIAGIKTGIYTAAGFFAALAGCAYALGYGSANVAVGTGYELQIIAACAIGGVSFTGGQGTVAGSLLGAATLQMLRELLTQLHVTDKYIEIAYGATILLAVAVDQFRRHPELGRWFRRQNG
jgi:ribose transport system permease protein